MSRCHAYALSIEYAVNSSNKVKLTIYESKRNVREAGA